MALKNTLDRDDVAVRLARALNRNLAVSDAEVTAVHVPSSSGLSNETVLFDATWTDARGARAEKLAARVQPAGPAVFPRYDLGLEFTVMSALAEHTDVPVPGMFFHEPDPELLGSPFLVMRQVDGRVPSDDPPYTAGGWVPELDPERQRTLHDNALRALVDIHAADIDRLGLGHLRDHPEAGIGGQLSLWRATFAWAAEGQSNPTVEAALTWLDDQRPSPTRAPVLNWGDARIGNILFGAGEDVRAVLDWEMTCVGPREHDLGWWLFMLRYYSEGIGTPQLPGFPTHDEVRTRYEAMSGVELDDLHYYEVLAALKLSVLLHRAGNLMIEFGQLPPDAPMRLSNPASHLLARLLDLPAPVGGSTQSFVGNRGSTS